jgi:ADP-ribose pyrophosphatase
MSLWHTTKKAPSDYWLLTTLYYFLRSVMQPETTISEEEIFAGKLITLKLRQVKLADGQIVPREVIKTRGAVAIVPLTAQNEVRLVKQFRSSAETWTIEIPAGTLEPAEDPAQAASRELMEETGDLAATWQRLGGVYSSPGILTEYLNIYLATDLTTGPTQPDFDEHIEILTVPWSAAMAMIGRGEIEDAKTVAGLMLAGLHLGVI